MKRFRTEQCLYGLEGLFRVRDNYRKSLGGKEPSKDNIPVVSVHPESDNKTDSKTAAGMPRRSLLLGRRLPFSRRVRACVVAKNLSKPEAAELDKALGDFQVYYRILNKALMGSHRYYSSKQYEKDAFKRGKLLHADLMKSFGELDKVAKPLIAASKTWLGGLGPATEKLDDAGKISTALINQARTFTQLAMAAKQDKAALKTSLRELSGEVAKLQQAKEKAPTSPFSRAVPPSAKRFVTAATAMLDPDGTTAASGANSATLRYKLSEAMAELVEVHHRSLGQLLRKRGDTRAGAPMRLLKPRLRARDGRPSLRSRHKGHDHKGHGDHKGHNH